MRELFIGLMSGTSVDGVDAALVAFENNAIDLIAFEYIAFSQQIKQNIRDISQPNSAVLLENVGRIDSELGYLFAEAVELLLRNTQIDPSEIRAIGSHGQTIYHAPEIPMPFSMQIGNPNIIAEQTGITTISDFRRRDMAAKGQGAPLVPAFHQAIFSQIFDLSKDNIVIVNIGGIANLSCLGTNPTFGFDTGTGNTLMDYWIQQNLQKDYDENGDWAKTGEVNLKLLSQLTQDPYFKLAPPKSTGKEYFSPAWLNDKLNTADYGKAEDIQATLCQLTAQTITDAIKQYAPNTEHTLICGGGVHNDYLVELIQNNLNHPVKSTGDFGIHPNHVEAMAFAWLARQSMNNLPGNLTAVTGANTPVILGGIYPGKNGLH